MKHIICIIISAVLLIGCNNTIREEANISIEEDEHLKTKLSESKEGIEENNKEVIIEKNKPIEDNSLKVSFNIFPTEDSDELTVAMVATPLEKKDENIVNDSDLSISVYSGSSDTEPIQVMKNKTNGLLFTEYSVVDANFDGFNDFTYIAYRGASSANSHYYLWDEDENKFYYSDDLSQIPQASFDYETKTVRGDWNAGGSNITTRLYKFIDDKLENIRVVSILSSEKEGVAVLSVKKIEDGNVCILIEKEVTQKNIDEAYDEYVLWTKSDYVGE